MKMEITDLTIEELKLELIRMGEQAYRAGQIFDWIYKKCCYDFKDMKNLPPAFKEKLSGHFTFTVISSVKVRRSKDGTEKSLLRVNKEDLVEAVFIPSGERATVCASTQVGCKFACKFCASGAHGFKRDLSPGEMVGQVLFVSKDHGVVSNVVFMGMGEPLDNLNNLMKAIQILSSKEGLCLPQRRITVSTCGIIPAIKKLQDSGLKINLSVSLHAADDELRRELMPISAKYPLKELTQVLARYASTTRSKITLEYALMKGVNDSIDMADKLSGISGKLRAKVNLIAMNPVEIKAGKGDVKRFKPPDAPDVEAFVGRLKALGVPVTVRLSRGSDIEAACGQLRMKGQDAT